MLLPTLGHHRHNLVVLVTIERTIDILLWLRTCEEVAVICLSLIVFGLLSFVWAFAHFGNARSTLEVLAPLSGMP